MILFSWNCRGISQASVVRHLRAIVQEFNPECIFLTETKVGVPKMQDIVNSLGFLHSEIVPAVNRSGGLCLCWRAGIDIEITVANESHISALVFSDPAETPWLLTCVYTSPYKHLQFHLWDSLAQTSVAHAGP
ncbi:hypothetical protein L1049_014747 [Liquidambar formosana]|uniref:Endonuclease/exonuclease/phosphatase domain-containing protein n=1 Tax=Liquidambar formosana TaxID=63359 RepID=A0AAP0RWJ4_LIQFO